MTPGANATLYLWRHRLGELFYWAAMRLLRRPYHPAVTLAGLDFMYQEFVRRPRDALTQPFIEVWPQFREVLGESVSSWRGRDT